MDAAPSVPNATETGAAGDAVISPGLPVDPRSDPQLARLPGMRALGPADWIIIDGAYRGQMQLRDELAARPGCVIETGGAGAAIAELGERLRHALSRLNGYEVGKDSVRRPDGVEVRGGDLASLARLTPMDLCIVEPQGGCHVLTAGALLFPASWTLAEKIGCPLGAIHTPVESYDDVLARRVDRLLNALHRDRPLWRMNALRYVDPALHQPRSETARRDRGAPGGWLRCERQCILKLPRSGAAVCSIQTFVVPWSEPQA